MEPDHHTSDTEVWWSGQVYRVVLCLSDTPIMTLADPGLTDAHLGHKALRRPSVDPKVAGRLVEVECSPN